MQRTRFLSLVRAVRRAAEAMGIDGDVLADVNELPSCGSYRQQLTCAQIYLSVTPRPATPAERKLVARLSRAVTMTSTTPPRRRRAAG